MAIDDMLSATLIGTLDESDSGFVQGRRGFEFAAEWMAKQFAETRMFGAVKAADNVTLRREGRIVWMTPDPKPATPGACR